MSYAFAIISSFAVGALLIWWIQRYAPTPRDRKLGVGGVVLLFLVSGLLGASGVLRDFVPVPPPLMRFIAALFVAVIVIVLLPWGGRVARATPLRVLVGMQGFRILPELLLDLGWRDGIVPVQMTWHGRNLDVLTALTAIVLAIVWPRLRHPRAWAWAFSVLSIGLLVNVLSIAVLSMPTPFRHFMNEPAVTFPARFPYVWLPGVQVFAALLLQGLTLRKLLQPHT